MIPRIRRVQIKNYKSLVAVDTTLEPFTVFVGPNASGKSNFFDALSFVQESLSESVSVAVGRRGGMSMVLSRHLKPVWVDPPNPELAPEDRLAELDRSMARATPVGIRLVIDLGDRSVADYGMSVVANEWGQVAVARERCVLSHPDREMIGFETVNGVFTRPIEGVVPVVLADRLALFAAAAREEFRPLFDFILRMGLYSIVPDRLREPQQPDLGEFLRTDGSNAVYVLKNFYRYGELAERYREHLHGLLGVIAEGVTRVYDLSFGPKRELWFDQNLGSYGERAFPALCMSDGTLRALGIILAILQPNTPSVTGIEEPEMTMHPALAEVLMDLFLGATGDRQVLITTHSPDLIDFKELEVEQIRLVYLRDGRTVIAPVSDPLRSILKERLTLPGELMSVGELGPEPEAESPEVEEPDLFGPAFPPAA